MAFAGRQDICKNTAINNTRSALHDPALSKRGAACIGRDLFLSLLMLHFSVAFLFTCASYFYRSPNGGWKGLCELRGMSYQNITFRWRKKRALFKARKQLPAKQNRPTRILRIGFIDNLFLVLKSFVGKIVLA